MGSLACCVEALATLSLIWIRAAHAALSLLKSLREAQFFFFDDSGVPDPAWPGEPVSLPAQDRSYFFLAFFPSGGVVVGEEGSLSQSK